MYVYMGEMSTYIRLLYPVVKVINSRIIKVIQFLPVYYYTVGYKGSS